MAFTYRKKKKRLRKNNNFSIKSNRSRFYNLKYQRYNKFQLNKKIQKINKRKNLAYRSFFKNLAYRFFFKNLAYKSFFKKWVIFSNNIVWIFFKLMFIPACQFIASIFSEDNTFWLKLLANLKYWIPVYIIFWVIILFDIFFLH